MENYRSQRIVLVVTNDLAGDQRLNKMAVSLQKRNWNPILIGRILPDSKHLTRSYRVIRLKMIFLRGPLFYAFFNLRIFFRLIFMRASLFVANDLDTLPGVWFASKLRRIPLVYDSHEYFTGVPELENRKKIKKIWKNIERKIQPHLKYVLTVNDSLAEIFRKEYQQEITVIKNLPVTISKIDTVGKLPEGFSEKPIIIYQGAVNVGRGLEEMIMAMKHLPEYNLLIVGGGDKLESLKIMVDKHELNDCIHFVGRVPFESLGWYTLQAKVGISIEQDIGLNYRFALPNKLFDYMSAGLPVIASDLPEIRKLVEEVGFGTILSDFSPKSIADSIITLLNDKELYNRYRQNALVKAADYKWERQEDKLLEFYDRALNQI